MPPSINLIASLLTGSVPLLLIIGVGFILWALMGTPLSTLQATRYMLAWSLDRTVPRQLGEVNDRFHTPVKAIVLCAITGDDRADRAGPDRRRRACSARCSRRSSRSSW